MELQFLASKGILKSSWYDDNEQSINTMQQQIYRLNSNMFVIGKVLSFPFEYVYSEYPLFWGLTVDSLFETSILIIWKVVAEGDIGGFTMQKFKKGVLKNLCDVNYRKKYREICDKVNFDKTASVLRKDIVLFRDKFAENFNNKLKGVPGALDIKLKAEQFEPLKQFSLELNILFQALSFDRPKKMTPDKYGGDPEQKGSSDIEKILGDILRKSVWLNQPERNAEVWKAMRSKKSDIEIRLMNKYRAKLGMPPVH